MHRPDPSVQGRKAPHPKPTSPILNPTAPSTLAFHPSPIPRPNPNTPPQHQVTY